MNRAALYIVLLTFLYVLGCDTKDNVKPRNENFFVKMYDGVLPGDQFGVDVIETSDGGLLIAGTEMNDDGSEAMLLIKTNSKGEEEWVFSSSSVLVESARAKSVIELNDGSFVLGGTTVEATTRSVLIKVNSLGQGDMASIYYIETPIGATQYSNSLSKITQHQSQLLVGGNTMRPYQSISGPVGGSNLFLGLFDSDLTPILKQNKHIYYWGLQGDDLMAGAYMVRDPANIDASGQNEHFLAFGSTQNGNPNANKDFFYQGFTDIFAPVGGFIIEDPNSDQTCSGVFEFNDAYYAIGDEDGSNLFLVGLEFKGASTGDSDWQFKNSRGAINSTEDIVGKDVVIVNEDEAIVIGDILFATNNEIYLAGYDIPNKELLGNWPRSFGTTTSSYTSSAVTLLQDGSIVIVGTADLDPIKKILVIKTGSNGEMSF